MADPNRFSIPVIEFVTALMREKFPALNLSRGSPFYQAFIYPMSTLLQPFRDRMNTIKRNQSLLNYPVMQPAEMDRSVANFLVDRLLGSRSYGLQRVYFDEIRAIRVDTTAVFLDDSDRRWRPVNPVTMTEIEMSANVVVETQEYYVDVPVVAEADGSEYRAEAGQVNRVINVPGATRTTNLASYFSGGDEETNTELFVRTKQSITNQDLVKRDAISAAIKGAFPTVRNMAVIGFGDPEMSRDVVEAVVSIDQVLRFSYCRKVNLPLDSNGNVSWYDDSGNPVIAPPGGYVAAIADMTGVDFNSVLLSSSYDASIKISVQPGFRVTMYEGYAGDPDAGEYLVTVVEEAPVESGGAPVKVLRLNRPFSDPTMGSWDPVADFDKYSYTIIGGASTRSFHVGGKIDVYVDSMADEEDSVLVGALPEIAPGVSEVPVVDVNPTNQDTGLPLFESGKPFRLPTLNILKVEQVDHEDASKVERELIAGIHYVFVSAEARGRFTQAENDVLIIKGFEDDGVTPAFTGRRIKISYTTNQDIPLIQSWVNDLSRKDVTKDILVKPKKTAVLDIELSFSGTPEVSTVQDVLDELIRSKGFGSTITVHEIDAILAVFGVTNVKHPVSLRLRRDLGDGRTETESSQDSLTVKAREVFYPASTLSVTKVV